MITFFNIAGAMIYLDAQGRQTGYEDVFTKIDMCRAHRAFPKDSDAQAEIAALATAVKDATH